MAYSALPLQDHISETSTITNSYRTLKAAFGDGAVQVAGNGINTKNRIWNITYNNLRTTDYNTLMSFIDTVQGYVPFTATPAGETQQTWLLDPSSVQEKHIIYDFVNNEQIKTITFNAIRVYI